VEAVEAVLQALVLLELLQQAAAQLLVLLSLLAVELVEAKAQLSLVELLVYLVVVGHQYLVVLGQVQVLLR
jgi:hypothetical protein